MMTVENVIFIAILALIVIGYVYYGNKNGRSNG